MRRASITLALGLALSACGGSAPHSASTTRTGPTLTISAAQAAAQDKCLAAEGVSAKPTTPRCARILSAANLGGVIDCGRGVLTNGSCIFAGRVYRAFRRAYDYYGGGSAGSPTRMRIRDNPVRCDARGQPGVDFAQHGEWHCRSLISQVWVEIRYP